MPWIIEGGLEKLNLYAFSAQLGLLCGSEGKESACNSGDPGLIPGLGRSLGESESENHSVMSDSFLKEAPHLGLPVKLCRMTPLTFFCS